jgi:hypothetical protein
MPSQRSCRWFQAVFYPPCKLHCTVAWRPERAIGANAHWFSGCVGRLSTEQGSRSLGTRLTSGFRTSRWKWPLVRSEKIPAGQCRNAFLVVQLLHILKATAVTHTYAVAPKPEFFLALSSINLSTFCLGLLPFRRKRQHRPHHGRRHVGRSAAYGYPVCGKLPQNPPNGQGTHRVQHRAGRVAVRNKALVLREFLAQIGEDDPVILVAGSPCQDLTLYGPSKGKLGVCGERSRHFTVIPIIVAIIQTLQTSRFVFVTTENAGGYARSSLKVHA